jgi:hypothetical protein
MGRSAGRIFRSTSTEKNQVSFCGEERPNPSLKPSPNGKPPGRRYSALSLLLQRRPGAFPLVPA